MLREAAGSAPRVAEGGGGQIASADLPPGSGVLREAGSPSQRVPVALRGMVGSPPQWVPDGGGLRGQRSRSPHAAPLSQENPAGCRLVSTQRKAERTGWCRSVSLLNCIIVFQVHLALLLPEKLFHLRKASSVMKPTGLSSVPHRQAAPAEGSGSAAGKSPVSWLFYGSYCDLSSHLALEGFSLLPSQRCGTKTRFLLMFNTSIWVLPC